MIKDLIIPLGETDMKQSKSMSDGGNCSLRSTEPVFEFPVYHHVMGCIDGPSSTFGPNPVVEGKKLGPIARPGSKVSGTTTSSLMFGLPSPTYSVCWNEL